MRTAQGKFRFALLLVFIETFHVSMAQDESVSHGGKLPLETSVKVLRIATSPPPLMEMQPMQRRVPTPTTPGARHPQYQLGHQQRQNPVTRDVDNPRVRFFLTLPSGPVLLEASIAIDGLPFQMVRQERVEQILKEVASETKIATANPPTAETNSDSLANAAKVTEPLSDIPDRLRHTMKLTGETPTAEEVHWIISNWVDGPTLMQLNDNFQRFRANQRPEFVILDRNRDGMISPEELQQAVQSFQESDLNQDGLIQFTEIGVAAADPRIVVNQIESGNLLTLLPDEASAAIAYQRLIATKPPGQDAAPVTVPRFDTNGNGQFDSDELQAFRVGEPDLRLSIDFNTTHPEKSRIAVMAIANEFEKLVQRATADETGITLTIGGIPVIFAAVQMQAGDQISIGAVHDGYPFLPSLDPNDDGRLTIRELRGLLAALKTFDRNQDGALTLDEAQSPIRVCIGLGACVHKELAGIRSVYRKENSSPTVGPEWFARMDRNKDNDLTRGEFPGTDEQFKTLDADSDELVSAEEALKFDKKAEAAEKADDRPDSNQGAATKIDSTSIEEPKP